MQFLIIGASGRTGKLIVQEATAQGHQVTALVRNTQALEHREGLTIVEGTPSHEADIGRAVTASPTKPSAVIIALNAPRASDSPFSKPISPPRLMTDANRNALNVMRRHGIHKIVTMSAYGAGDSFPNLNFLMRWTVRGTNMNAQYQDHDDVDKLLRASDADFVLVRPAMLNGDEALPVKELGDAGERAPFMPSVSRASVAVFIVEAATSSAWDRRSPVISN